MTMYQQELEKLTVGSQVGYRSAWTRYNGDCKAATVVRITSTRVVVKLNDGSNNLEHAFMKRTGCEVGSSSSWRSAHLVAWASVIAARVRDQRVKDVRGTMENVNAIVANYIKYDRTTVKAEDKERLLQLINSL